MSIQDFCRVWACFVFIFGVHAGPKTQAQVPDIKYGTPRATIRTLYVSADLAREYPQHVADAVGCLDLSGLSSGSQLGGMIADRLEAILSALEIPTYQVPNDAKLEEYVIPNAQGYHLVLRRFPDGQYRFDRTTVGDIGRIWAELQKTIQAKNQQANAFDIRPEFASPRATFGTFMKALRREDVDTAMHCLDLHDISPAARTEVGQQLAHQLRQVIDRSRLVIFQQIPDTNHAPPYVWLSQPNGLIGFARQYSGPRKGEWLFSAATVHSIGGLYADSEGKPYVPEIRELVGTDPSPTFWHEPELWLRRQLPDGAMAAVFTTRMVHLKAYQLAGLVFLAVSWIGLYRIVRELARAVVLSLLRLAGAKLPANRLRPSLRAFGSLACIAYVRWGVLLLALDKILLASALTVLTPLVWLCVAWTALRLIDLLGDVVEARLTSSERHFVTSQMLLPIGSLLVKILILFATLFYLMHLFDWEVTAVLTGLGIGGLAFALGAQDSLKNLFGSFTLIADRPFVVGERVKIGQFGEGVVEIVGLRSTRIRTKENAILTVPNCDLTTMHITNYGRRRQCHYSVKLELVYSTLSEHLLTFRDGIQQIIRKMSMTDADKSSVAIADLNSSGIEVQVNVFFQVSDGMTEAVVREGFILEILRLAESLGIEFAVPKSAIMINVPGAELSQRPPSSARRSAEAA